MDLELGTQNLKRADVSLETFLSRISTGKAILFTGAGFSLNTKNLNGEEPPLAKGLAKKIAELGKMESSDNLMYVSDYYLTYKSKPNLLSLLKNNFVLDEVSEDHISICSIPWKRSYTTNYDNAIELSYRKNGKNVESLCIEDNPNDYIHIGNICLHINGKIENSTLDDLDSNIKLSNSSYISADCFTSSHWFYHFKRDLESCTALVFVGYSLYDLDIQKFLFDNPSIKERTYFITREEASHEETYFLGKFGHVLAIGVDGLSNIVQKNKDAILDQEHEDYTESLVKYEGTSDHINIRDAEVERFILHGDIKQSHLDRAISITQSIPYLINRNYVKEVCEALNDGNNVVLVSELGNGKSIILKSVVANLFKNGIDTYTLEDDEGDYLSDLDVLSKINKKLVVAVDDYDKYVDLIKHFDVTKPTNISLIITSRTSEHERHRHEFTSFESKFSEISIDILKKDEVESFIDIIDNIGIWGEIASWSHEKKTSHLIRKHHAQLSLILLDLFNSPYIVDKVKQITNDLFSNLKYKDTAFGIALIETVGLKPKSSLISELSLNNEIYDGRLTNNPSFRELFKVENNAATSKSSVFSLSLIKNYFSSNYIVEQLLLIAKHLNSEGGRSYEENTVFKALLKFSFIERLLPEQNRKNNLSRYYENLKIAAPWLKTSPHFWVQFGMSRLPYKDFKKAQDYFDQAYSFAKNRDNYHTENIDTQQARLYILQCLETKDTVQAVKYFQAADDLLNSLNDDIYKFRQVIKYKEVYIHKFAGLSNKQKVAFEHSCKNFQSSVERASQIGKISINDEKTISKVIETLDFIISDIKVKR
ncbi:SIR2 family protein [Pseudoalteromonas sp. SWN29]|uniref:SIR2 family protein n=1 Tax=Pseudoalteromonas sp. SWN29 TaxID=2792064 RepID=UPI0018CEA263|nr:SIR2 family protein [Pseudoalteromonas sp. SWN29]MBH0029186.1 SIR2 family protein [Pseudoalteromonas sp. SWN29]